MRFVKRSAGESVRQRYRLETRLLLGIMVAAFVLILWLAFSPDAARKHALVALLIVAALLLVFRKAENLFEISERTWGAGATAEEHTGAILRQMEEQGWRILHDLDTGRGNIDHVAIGPNGVFTIDTKSHRGRITISSGKLVRNGVELERDFLRQATAESLFIKDYVKERLGKSYFITPIIAFTRAFVQVPKSQIANTLIVPAKWLESELTKGPARLTPEEIEEISRSLSWLSIKRID